MHHRYQSGLRENPASNRRHGPRPVLHPSQEHSPDDGNEISERTTGEQLLTVADVAEMLKVRVSWVYEHTRPQCLKPIPHMKIGKYLRFSKRAILQYIETLQSCDYLSD